MRQIPILLLSLTCILFTPGFLHATHNRAGEISVEHVGDCTRSLAVKATVITYTKPGTVDRDSVTIEWGDGTSTTVPRINGSGSPGKGEAIENDTRKNIYIGIHTYPSRGTYQISMTDPNRNGGILNVNFPNSVQIRFHIQTTYTFPNPQFQGCNNTPVLLQPPVDVGCVGKRFIHNPNAFDLDGDSLSYHLIVPLAGPGIKVPNYQFPNEISPGPNNKLTINEITGDLVWESPQKRGEYNIAMIIVEHRNGTPIDTLIRDMQILIEDCDNRPPVIETSADELCVVAGELVEINVTATAPLEDTDQEVRLTALGGPFVTPYSPATFEPNSTQFREDPVQGTFRWQTTCEHISDQHYSVVFKAVDNGFKDTSGLATLKTIRIKVVGPPPELTEAIPGPGQVELFWTLPYTCEGAAENYFRGFTVWRRLGPENLPPDNCKPGLAGTGYEQITPFPIRDTKDGKYYFLDTDAERGRTYCYRVLALFAKTTPSGQFTYNWVESLPSNEVCVQLSRDLPLIVKADVKFTSPNLGEVEVCWTKPVADDLDTLVNKGPYRYELLRATGLTAQASDFQSLGVNLSSPFFATANDTCYTDTQLNTQDNAYSYKVNFHTGPTLQGATNEASTVYLTLRPTDRQLILSWRETVPWNNFEYTVFRLNEQGLFDSIANTTASNYTDRGLDNAKLYCYKIRSSGTYGIDGVKEPLLNFSQEACDFPIDNVPPCPPSLNVVNVCNEAIDCTNEKDLFNTLIWNISPDGCNDPADVEGYRIYFSPIKGAALELIADINNGKTKTFEHQPQIGIAGCYAITAYDSLGNESRSIDTVCVDNCPNYTLPNAFTPNGDSFNDQYVPYPYCFIASVEFKVFNRWGQLVFETEDPDLNWKGTNLQNKELAPGVYYYTCKVFERRVDGINLRTEVLTGWIELLH